MSAPLRHGAALARQRLAGVAFLLVITLLLALSVALYQKRFADVVEVELATDSIGNQLSVNGDVKVRGLIVGRITEVDSDGTGAMITLAIDRSKASLVPSDAVGRLLPKTLFGEKYVALMTTDASARAVRDGDRLEQDRSARGIETAEVLDDLLPLLKALDPEDLSATLSAVSGALRGRGEAIGQNLVRTRDYLRELNPELPTLQEDLRGLADLADTVDEAAPDLLAVLDDLSFSSRSLQEQEGQFARFLSATTSFASSADSVLRQNEQRLVRLASDSRAPLELLADYSPAYGCFLRGLDRYNRIVGTTFGGAQPGLRITLEVTRDNGAFVEGDEPAYLDDGPPACRGLPTPSMPAPDEEFVDGYRDAERAGLSARDAVGPQVLDQQLLAGLSAPVLGVPADQVPDLAGLLLGPVARGTTAGLTEGATP